MSDTSGDQIELAYSRIGLVIVLYVVVKVSLFWPHLFDVSDFKMLRVDCALSFVLFMCSPKLSFESNVSPSILGWCV